MMKTVRRLVTALAVVVAFVAGWVARDVALEASSQQQNGSVENTDTPNPDDSDEFEALCTRVIDGDTIELADGEHVRYIGMDTAEMRPIEAYARAATEANREMVEGEMVRLVLDVEKRDRYGRLLAYVYVDDTFVNAELVRRGLAQVATYPPNVRHQEHFLKLQREAREAGRGLWSEDGGDMGG